MPELRVLALYADLMNTYADRGNLLLLKRRCAWRGIGFLLLGAVSGQPLSPLEDGLEQPAHPEARHAAGI